VVQRLPAKGGGSSGLLVIPGRSGDLLNAPGTAGTPLLGSPVPGAPAVAVTPSSETQAAALRKALAAQSLQCVRSLHRQGRLTATEKTTLIADVLGSLSDAVGAAGGDRDDSGRTQQPLGGPLQCAYALLVLGCTELDARLQRALQHRVDTQSRAVNPVSEEGLSDFEAYCHRRAQQLHDSDEIGAT
jgi:hypothetical protein